VTAGNTGGAIQADSARVTVAGAHKAAARRKTKQAKRRRALTRRKRRKR
jgi:hypothetical protein